MDGKRGMSARRATYSCWWRRLSISSRVVDETCGRPLTTLDTVATDTPASDAIVARVVRSLLVFTRPSSLSHSLPDRRFAQLGQLDRGRQLPVGTDDPCAAGEPDRPTARQVYRRVADEYFYASRFHDPLEAAV